MVQSYCRVRSSGPAFQPDLSAYQSSNFLLFFSLPSSSLSSYHTLISFVIVVSIVVHSCYCPRWSAFSWALSLTRPRGISRFACACLSDVSFEDGRHLLTRSVAVLSIPDWSSRQRYATTYHFFFTCNHCYTAGSNMNTRDATPLYRCHLHAQTSRVWPLPGLASQLKCFRDERNRGDAPLWLGPGL